MSVKRGLASAAGIIIFFNIFGKVFGLLRERAIGVAFGTSNLTDAFVVANTIPTIAFFAIGGALSTSLIPVYKEQLAQKGQVKADKLVSNIINISFLLLAIFSILGIVLAPNIIKLLAPGFDKESLELATKISQIIFPAIPFMSIGVLMSGILNSKGHFTVPAALPLIQSLTIIAFVHIFSDSLGIFSLALGTLAGVIIQPFLQIPVLSKKRLQYKLSLDFKNTEVRKVFALVGPVIIATSVVQLYLAVSRILGSGLPEGSLAALNFAYLLIQLPLGIFVSAIATVIFPLMAEQATEKDRWSMAYTLFTGLRTMAFLIIPASLGLLVLRKPIIQLIYQSGAFDAKATEITSFALLFFSIGLLGFSLPYIVNRAYYAFQDTKTPLKIGLVSVVINIVLSLILMPIFAHGGLALANSLAAFCNAFLLIFFVKRHLPDLSIKEIFKSLMLITLASLIMIAVVFGVSGILENFINMNNKGGQALFIGFNVLVGALVYILAVFAFKLEEGRLFLDIIKKQLPKSRKS